MLLFSLTADENNNPKNKKMRQLNEDLIHRTAAGDMIAMEELYINTKSDIYGYALSILKNAENAKDVMQETYLKIYKNGENYIPQGKPMAWMLTIVRNLSLMKLREKSNKDSSVNESYDLQSGEKTEISAENSILLNAAMIILNDEERQILMLHAVSGLKHREIAQILKLPLSTVLSKYNRSLSKLKKCMEEE